MIADIYVRTLTVANRLGPEAAPESPEDQETAIRNHLIGEGYTVRNVYRDIETDGSSTLRPGLQSLMWDMRQPNYPALAVGVLSVTRISREADVMAEFGRYLAAKGVQLVAVSK